MCTYDTDWPQTDHSEIQHPIFLRHLRPPIILQNAYDTLRTRPAREARDGVALAFDDGLDLRMLHTLEGGEDAGGQDVGEEEQRRIRERGERPGCRWCAGRGDDEERAACFGDADVLGLTAWKGPGAEEELVSAARGEADAAEAACICV